MHICVHQLKNMSNVNQCNTSSTGVGHEIDVAKRSYAVPTISSQAKRQNVISEWESCTTKLLGS